jgi:putative oxidoreductase
VVKRILGGFSEDFYAILRIVAGLLFACHGAQKILGMLGGMGGNGATAEFLTRTWFAGIIELGGGLLIALGLGTGIAAFIASGEMAAAYFIAHAPQAFWPIQNRGELAIVYCFLWLYVASRGAGKWSLDSMMK